MEKILLLTDKPFAQVAVDGIQKVVSEAGYELKLCEKYGTDMDRVKRAVSDVEALIIRSDKVTAEIMDAAPNLKIIVRAGAGYDNVDLEAATERNICVMNTPGQNSNGVAELAFGMMVMAIRNFYNGTSGFELKGKKLGIHAYGNVGRNVARIAKGFGMEIYAFDAYCPKEAIEADGVIPVASAEELYETCNVVSIHIPATPGTRMSINYNLLNRMPGIQLTNEVAGHHVHEGLTTEEFELIYGAVPLKKDDIKHSILVIKINKLYRRGMSDKELYDVVRGFWNVSLKSIKEKNTYNKEISNSWWFIRYC